jgi:hypothetical protein
MIDDRLDSLARRLAGDAPRVARGSLLRRFSAALVGGGVAAAVLAPDASAAKVRCQPGHVACKGRCRNVMIDPDACGRCGHVCSPSQVCRNGHCVNLPCTCLADCPQGTTRCGTTCVDTTTSATNCGSCGTHCTGPMVCVDGACSAPNPVCGNGVLETGEQCDGPALGGATCQSLGFVGGTLACSNVCRFDTSGCVPACSTNADCGASTECVTYTCSTGVCGTSNQPYGTPIAAQTAGDCHQVVCDGAGGTTSAIDNGDPPSSSTCVSWTCINGNPSASYASDGTACVTPGGPGICQSGVCA